MKLNETQANDIFTILADHGNYDKGMIDYKRAEFVHTMTTGNGAREHWYPTNNHSSVKVYFNEGFLGNPPRIYIYAQTCSVHDKGIVEATNAALEAYVAGK